MFIKAEIEIEIISPKVLTTTKILVKIQASARKILKITKLTAMLNGRKIHIPLNHLKRIKLKNPLPVEVAQPTLEPNLKTKKLNPYFRRATLRCQTKELITHGN